MVMKKGQAGFSVIPTLVLITVLVVGAAIAWRVNINRRADKPNNSQQTSQPESRKSNTNPYQGWKAYHNEKYGISFYYPNDWKAEEVPVETPSGLTPTEFAVNLKMNISEKYAETASIEVHTKNANDIAQIFEDYYKQSTTAKVEKTRQTIKGKDRYHITVTQPSGEKVEHYIFAANDKSYSFRSVNETINLSRSPQYWDNFQKTFDSLELK